MTKSLRGRGDAAPFFGSEILNARAANCAEPRPKVPRSRAKRNGNLQDAIIDGERVLLVTSKALIENERGVEIRTRVALNAAGVLVMKHTVEVCHKCRARPSERTGLGKGASDLFCIVPPYGRVVVIEMKKPGYSPSDVRPDQHCFIRAVRRVGGIGGIASSPEEALALIELARRLT